MATNVFVAPEGLPSVSGGMNQFTISQQPADQGSTSGTLQSSNGLTSGQTTYTFNNAGQWWIPAESYVEIKGCFLNAAGTATLAATSGILPCENWPAALFNQVAIVLESQEIERTMFVPQTDSMAVASGMTRQYQQTTGSGTGSNFTDSYYDRLCAASGLGLAGGATAPHIITAAWRPSLSLWSVKEPILGGSWQLQLLWNPTANQTILGETTATKVAGTDYIFKIISMNLFMARCKPSPEALAGVNPLRTINLTPIYTSFTACATSTATVQQVIKPSTFRVIVGFQHHNAGTGTAVTLTSVAGASTRTASIPITWFNDLGLASYYITLPGINAQIPQTTYTPCAAQRDCVRLYKDFIDATCGDFDFSEGCVPYGNCDPMMMGVKTTLIPSIQGTLTSNAGADDVTCTEVKATTASTAPVAGQYFQIDPLGPDAASGASAVAAGVNLPIDLLPGMTGWLGRNFLIAAQIAKDKGAKVSTINVYANFSDAQGTPASFASGVIAGGSSVWGPVGVRNCYIFAVYSAALALKYNLAQGGIESWEWAPDA